MGCKDIGIIKSRVCDKDAIPLILIFFNFKSYEKSTEDRSAKNVKIMPSIIFKMCHFMGWGEYMIIFITKAGLINIFFVYIIYITKENSKADVVYETYLKINLIIIK